MSRQPSDAAAHITLASTLLSNAEISSCPIFHPSRRLTGAVPQICTKPNPPIQSSPVGGAIAMPAGNACGTECDRCVSENQVLGFLLLFWSRPPHSGSATLVFCSDITIGFGAACGYHPHPAFRNLCGLNSDCNLGMFFQKALTSTTREKKKRIAGQRGCGDTGSRTRNQ